MAYVFDPERLHQVTKNAAGMPVEQAFDQITRELAQTYPGHIRTGPRSWVFNNAGGAMGQIAILHASLSEYILIFGTPIGTEGHSGRYATEVWDFVIDGEMWCYLEGQSERVVYEPGDAAYLGRSQVKGYRVPDHVWMLEYARGPVATMLPFALADTLTSTLDTRTLGRTLWQYTKQVTTQLARGKL
jgi:C-8 sterol isomerase